MKLDWRLVLVLVLSLGLMVSCEDTTDDDDDATAFEILSDYMVENDLDSPTIISGWIVAAADVVGNEGDYFIVDIRDEARYNAGHITGAVNSTYGNILTTVETYNTDDKPVLVACYSGQSAAHAVVALRLSGYSDAKTLKFGMSSWARAGAGDVSFDSWTGNVGNYATDNGGHANWSTDAPPTLPSGFDDPMLDTDLTDGAAILAERVDAILAGFNGTPSATIIDTPDNYQIINYWAEADWTTYGHIAGAYQVTPGTLTLADDAINMLDPSMEIVTYCWTGQTSSMMTAWLVALGYDATSLKFGVNSLIYDTLTGHKWGGPLTSDYPME